MKQNRTIGSVFRLFWRPKLLKPSLAAEKAAVSFLLRILTCPTNSVLKIHMLINMGTIDTNLLSVLRLICAERVKIDTWMTKITSFVWFRNHFKNNRDIPLLLMSNK